jgi:hypothetical protein
LFRNGSLKVGLIGVSRFGHANCDNPSCKIMPSSHEHMTARRRVTALSSDDTPMSPIERGRVQDEAVGMQKAPQQANITSQMCVMLLVCGCIVGPALIHVIGSDWEKYAASEKISVWFTANHTIDSLCWLPGGRHGVVDPAHCRPFPSWAEGDSAPRQIPMQTYSGHCFAFLFHGGSIAGHACIIAGQTEYTAEQPTLPTPFARLVHLQKLLVAALAQHRRAIYRALQFLLLLDALLYGTRASPHTNGSTLTTHHLFVAVGVATMLLDHFAKGVLGMVGSVLIVPAQFFGGAPPELP